MADDRVLPHWTEWISIEKMNDSPETRLQRFGQNIWIADGPNVRDMGLLFTTRMTVIKLSDGSLWLESPVTPSAETLEQIRQLGAVRYLVAATQRHIWRLSAWHELFPDAQVWAPRNARLAVGTVPATARDLFTDTPPEEWKQDLEQLAFRGSALLKEVAFFHRISHSVILGDIVQANPIIRGTPFRNILITAFGVAAPDGGVPPDIRLSFRDRDLARQSLDTMLAWNFDKLIIAHGACIRSDAKTYVQNAFRWLTK
jgi:Domain of unknown function (DUF4336)